LSLAGRYKSLAGGHTATVRCCHWQVGISLYQEDIQLQSGVVTGR
jgi:hypothetical protein